MKSKRAVFSVLMILALCTQAYKTNSEPEQARDQATEQFQTSAAANPATYLAEVQKQLPMHWPKNKTINIVCHGHSVPAGYFKTPHVDTFNAYPHLLHVVLKKRHSEAVLNVINTAIGGENAVTGAERFESDVLTHKPDLITIDYCLNDRRVGLKKSREAWESMIKQANDAGIPVLLLTPTPDQRAEMHAPEDPLNQHAEQVRQLAAEYQVGLVDSYAAFKHAIAGGAKLKDLMSQGNHPNRAGHDLILAELLKWFPEPEVDTETHDNEKPSTP